MRKLIFVVALVGVLIGSTLGGIALAGKPEAVTPLDTLGEINQKTSTILEGVGNITDKLEDPAYGLEEIKTEIASIETTVSDINTDISTMGSDVGSIESKVGNISDEITSTEHGLAEIKTEVAGIETAVNGISTDVSTIGSDVDSILDALQFDLEPLLTAMGSVVRMETEERSISFLSGWEEVVYDFSYPELRHVSVTLLTAYIDHIAYGDYVDVDVTIGLDPWRSVERLLHITDNDLYIAEFDARDWQLKIHGGSIVEVYLNITTTYVPETI